ncbi:Six-hairpin glycosidase-like protein [Endogone sp. FLAS-F59071]|nr:Six-hairpin glycosidase-like protein [Endogone sp. FLAS-F59071]|eukprot:RUS22569.1 Six-hairpin glycosidase-like protein [Endogone sp. FLAS-F59071]
MADKSTLTAEQQRLVEYKNKVKHWRRWGPYLSERQWATVREDYSFDGNAWSNFPHDQARSRAYRWGEDGIAGISDNHQRLCFSVAVWNGNDSIIKERLFGMTGHEGNHGEDVKEFYYYLDNTPSHSYMKYLYKYPHAAYPYTQLREMNTSRTRNENEFELTDTGVFNEDKYFDVFIEYAKSSNPEDILIKITAHNRSPTTAHPLHIIPQLWFRNTWSWDSQESLDMPNTKEISTPDPNSRTIEADHYTLKTRYLHCSTSPHQPRDLLFTDNETNNQHLFQTPNRTRYAKDGVNDRVVNNVEDAVNPEKTGTKSAIWYTFDEVPAGGNVQVKLRLTNVKESPTGWFSEKFDEIFEERKREADEFYDTLAPEGLPEDLRNVQRQAFAGMLWSKQFFHLDVERWLSGDPVFPPPPTSRKFSRNCYVDDILSMPDKWEYPFFAAWDLAFHTIPLVMIDPDFAKRQLDLLTREWYMHPSGQIPAYEWNFSDVNPPVHAWAALQLYKLEYRIHGQHDRLFLERVFQKLLLNFTWWVNRKDEGGSGVFEGGFLGLDNIGLFNRSESLPTGGKLRQADGTAWMAFFALNMLDIALELAQENPAYEDIASKFFEHFLHISDAMTYRGNDPDIPAEPLWDDQDGFYYDSIAWDDGSSERLRTRSLVGLIPLYACLVLEPESMQACPGFTKRMNWFLNNRKELACKNIASIEKTGMGERRLLALVNKERMTLILQRMLDESEFFSDYGIRSLSKYHYENPVYREVNGEEFRVQYLPGESDSGLFGGNSNWRGPIWMPTTYLLMYSLQRFHHYYGEETVFECPTGSGKFMNLNQIAEEIQHRVMHIFCRDTKGRRATNSGNDTFDFDPHWKDHVLFYEYFHADTGRGMGASHQTGWTGLVAKMIFDVGISCRIPRA